MIKVDDKLPDVAVKDVVILITCVIQDNDKFYPQIFLGKALVALKISSIGTF